MGTFSCRSPSHIHHYKLLTMVEEEYFWAAVLDSKTKVIEWNPEKDFPKDEKEDGMPIPRHSLMIKQAILSHEAAEGEVAVIEAEAMGYAGRDQNPHCCDGS